MSNSEYSTNGSTLPVHDVKLKVYDSEPRARDLDIAKRLGFSRPRKIRDLIERKRDELEAFGTLAPHRGAQLRENGATHEVTEYWLNEEQALLISSVSDAPRAPEVRSMLIRVFVAYRRGHLVPNDRPKIVTGAVRMLNAYTRAGRLLGLDANQAAFRASRAVERNIGVNFIEELGVDRLEASGEAAGMNATALAHKVGRRNARILNIELFDGGFQKRNEAGEWVLTDKGEQYGREYDVMPSHGKGRSRPQILWTEAIIPVLTGEATH